jgi:DNA polymerase elongation subunit (family B)
MKKVVFDIETKDTFEQVGSNDPTMLSISLVGIYRSETDSYHTYLEDELPKLWPILESADVIIGYNSDHFDTPILNKYYPGDLSVLKQIDLMKEIRRSFGRRVGLNAVAEATLNIKKSGNGLDAIIWWRNGEIEKIKEYCLQDVKITKEIYDYVVEYQTLKIKDKKTGKIIEVPISTQGWNDDDAESITPSLPLFQ